MSVVIDYGVMPAAYSCANSMTAIVFAGGMIKLWNTVAFASEWQISKENENLIIKTCMVFAAITGTLIGLEGSMSGQEIISGTIICLISAGAISSHVMLGLGATKIFSASDKISKWLLKFSLPIMGVAGAMNGYREIERLIDRIRHIADLLAK